MQENECSESPERFLAAAAEIRPQLHRFCSRMSGSVLDGEDLVQETLERAFFQLPTLKEAQSLEAWLFRIAHNKCIDFLRKRRREPGEPVPFDDEFGTGVAPAEPLETRQQIGQAIAALVTHLPPKERACVVLKEVLDYSLQEIAEIVDSTVGGVKAALHRGRAKLANLRVEQPASELDPEERNLIEAYLERFNRQDWQAVQELLRADARLEVVDRSAGTIGSDYFSNYMALPWRWKFALATVDGEPMAVHFKHVDGTWRPQAAVKLWFEDGQVVAIRDYVHIDYLLWDANIVLLDPCSQDDREK